MKLNLGLLQICRQRSKAGFDGGVVGFDNGMVLRVHVEDMELARFYEIHFGPLRCELAG